MKLVNKKTKAILIALILMLTITVSSIFVALPSANAHTPSWKIPTYIYVSFNLNPAGVGQNVLVVWWLDKSPPTATGIYGDRWKGVTVDMTKPDGTKETLGPFSSDPVGGNYINFVPEQIGNYTFQANFPEQMLVNANPAPANASGGVVGGGTFGSNAYINDTYLSSTSSPVTLVVQQDQILAYPDTPLPNDYWARPIEAENRGWSVLASNWLAGSAIVNSFQPYGQAPNSSHILWTKPITFGGIADGFSGDIPYYEGLSYGNFWSGVIIMDGVLYYNTPTPPMYGWYAVDLMTGQQIYWHNSTGSLSVGVTTITWPRLSFGQLYDFETPDQHGVLSPYLWSTSGTTWYWYDAFTGNYITSIVNVPGGASATSSDGSKLVYVLNVGGKWLAEWNSSLAIPVPATPYYPYPNRGDGYWMWVPPVGAAPIDGSHGYSWNVTIPQLPTLTSPWASTPAISKVGADYLLCIAGVGTGVTGAGQSGTDDPWYACALSLKPGQEGTMLWQKNYTAPSGNQSLVVGPMDNGVFCMSIKETMQWYGYDAYTGNLLWGPTAPQTAYDMYGMGGSIAYGKLYSCGYGGILYCYNLTTGKLLWRYTPESSGTESPYGHYPLSIGAIADGKVYLYSTEHSPSKPAWRGSKLRCVEAQTGKELWKVLNWAQGPAIADGCLATLNGYDNQIYCFSRGPSATTVEAPLNVIPQGSGLVIRGTVTDVSAGTKQTVQSVDFPNGVPCVSDASESDWMEYVYMQKPFPTNATGVPVSIDVIDANGNYRNIGNTTSDSSGMFTFMWTPDIPGSYNVIATFAGSESYWPSSAESSFAVGAAAPTASPQPVAALPPIEMYIVGGVVAIIIAIAIVGALMLMAVRKRS